MDSVAWPTLRLDPVTGCYRPLVTPPRPTGTLCAPACTWLQVWAQPHAFLPQRWLPEGAARGLAPSNPAAYTPFGQGTRLCVGHKLATLVGPGGTGPGVTVAVSWW